MQNRSSKKTACENYRDLLINPPSKNKIHCYSSMNMPAYLLFKVPVLETKCKTKEQIDIEALNEAKAACRAETKHPSFRYR